MRWSCLSLALLAATAGCAGDHIDILSTFRITGEVRTATGQRPVSGSMVRITLRDVAMDDSRRPEQRVIVRRNLPLVEPFVFVQTYFWGTTVDDPDDIPPSVDDLSIDIELDGCRTWQRTVSTSDLPLEDGASHISLGSVELDC